MLLFAAGESAGPRGPFAGGEFHGRLGPRADLDRCLAKSTPGGSSV